MRSPDTRHDMRLCLQFRGGVLPFISAFDRMASKANRCGVGFKILTNSEDRLSPPVSFSNHFPGILYVYFVTFIVDLFIGSRVTCDTATFLSIFGFPNLIVFKLWAHIAQTDRLPYVMWT